MASRWACASRVICLSLAMALAGCVQPPPVASRQTPSTSPRVILSGIPLNQASAYARIQTELVAFLDLWKTKGYGPASEAYLVPGEQVTSPDVGPVLTSGRVTAFSPDPWTSEDHVVAAVDLDLTFSGDPGAWGTGVNSRFVTATARTGTIPYVLELATGR